MPSATFAARRGELETYFDRTAADAWAQLTSTAPVSRIRATVRAGRDRMRAALLSWLDADLTGRRVLDAGCGPGDAARALAARGADVVGVDVSASLIDVARKRSEGASGRLNFQVGDMLDPMFGRFDHVLAMDSLIHYDAADIVEALAALAARCDRSIVFTHAPRTAMLVVMHAVGRLFPRADRAPAIAPVAHGDLTRRIGADPRFAGWRIVRRAEIASGFYMSHAMELVRP